MDGGDVGGDVVLLGIAEDEDVVLPLVIFPAVRTYFEFKSQTRNFLENLPRNTPPTCTNSYQ